MTSVKEEISRYSNQYSTRLTTHPNDQILTLMEISGATSIALVSPHTQMTKY
jgi:hypothetical protein